MDPIYPWLDPNEVRLLADHLLKPHRIPAIPDAVTDVGFDKGFVGFEATEPQQAKQAAVQPTVQPTIPPPTIPQAVVPSQPVAPPRQTTPPPLPPQEQATPPASPLQEKQAPPVSEVPQIPATPVSSPPPAIPAAQEEKQPVESNSLQERVTHLRDWMNENFSATGIFILDHEGAVVFDESNHGRLHFLARSLALSPRRPGTAAANVHMKISAASVLEVIPVETAGSNLVLGAVVPGPLDPEAISAITQALAQVASQSK